MTLRQFARIVEIRTKIISVSGLTIGALLSLYLFPRFYWDRFLVMVVATLCVDMGTTAFNSFFDYEKGVDSRDSNRESDKVLVHEGVAPGLALLIAMGLFAVAAVLGLVLGYLSGWAVVFAGALCMAVGFFYNGGPVPLSSTPAGEIFAGGFLGTVLILITVYVAAGELDGRVALATIPSFLLIASILTVNNTCDIEGDTAGGRLTLSIAVGARASAALVYVLGALAFGALIAFGAYGVLPIESTVAGGIGVVVAFPTYRTMARRGFSHATKGPSMGAISRVFTIFTGAYCAALIVALIRTMSV
ncbi:MAG: prenyltransferase [Spirochaetaceae bacterium]|nr:MAG: prenyltransferase [Spirochaetaceae bacterium]